MRLRHAVLPTPSISFRLPRKSHEIISFTNHHPLTLLESYRFKSSAGRGYSRHSLSAKSLPFNLFADPHPLNPVVSIFYKNTVGKGYAHRSLSPKLFPCHTSENSPVSPAIATDPKTPLCKSRICHTSETPGGCLSFQPACPAFSGRAAKVNSRHAIVSGPFLYFTIPFSSYSCALFCTISRSAKTQLLSFQTIPYSLPKKPEWGRYEPTISAARLFQLQSPGCKWHAANPHALWVQERTDGSEVRE